jgi:hypothetical protein
MPILSTRQALGWAVVVIGVLCSAGALAQGADPKEWTLALPNHSGQLAWSAPGFKITENSAKAGGREIGFRGFDASARLGYLSFLFLFPEQAPLTSAKCRDGVIGPEKKANPTYKELSSSESPGQKGISVITVGYSVLGSDHKPHYSVRSFAASGDICGDFELYSSEPIRPEDPRIRAILASYRLDPDYSPKFRDVFQYAQVLFNSERYKDAAPIFEQALGMVPADGTPFPSAKLARRVATDQAGMSYGISGQYAKARAIFEAGVAGDPDYPMYYYNLACADAGEDKLPAAQAHLEQAFVRKANVNPGESMPDPTKDDSFMPFKSNKAFWAALEKMKSGN